MLSLGALKLRKLTKEEFINREPDLLSGEYEILGDYVNTMTKVLFKHVTCGYEWMVKPSSFHIGRRCPKCANQKKGALKRLTKEEFINREKDILSGEYLIVGVYKNTQTKVLIKHNKCGYEWMIAPNNFRRGTRCPKCAFKRVVSKKVVSKKVVSKEEFITREPDLLSGEYEFVGDYINTQTKVLFKHNICGYEWMIAPCGFHRGTRCPKCGGTKKLTKDEFCEREDDIQSGEYSMIGSYRGTQVKTLFKHNKCGYEWKCRPGYFKNGKRCPRCSETQKLTKKEFCEREDDIASGEYTMLGDYASVRKKTLFKHNLCGYEWEATPGNFYQGQRCPKCNASKGETKISKVLEKINIPFESQKRFNSCKYKKTLPFDFYVNDSFLIEYDGAQHFTEVDYFGGEQGLKIRQLRDNIKTQWAKDNGIPLVRIPYTEFDNIEQIIKESIEKYSIKKAG